MQSLDTETGGLLASCITCLSQALRAPCLCPQVIFELKAQRHSGAGLTGNYKDFCSFQDSAHSCQQADATGSGIPSVSVKQQMREAWCRQRLNRP